MADFAQTALALNATQRMLDVAGGRAPDWIELVPAGPVIAGRDGRSFTMTDPALVIESTRAVGKLPMVLDFDHATERPELAANAGAAGWIEDLAVRGGSIWGRVDWTPRGRAAVEGREYRFVSPVLLHAKDAGQRVVSLVSAGLVHQPNFRQLAALNAAEPPNLEKAENMIVNRGNLTDLQVGFKTNFGIGFSGVQPQYPKICTIVPSKTSEDRYAWLGEFPSMREWIGERIIRNLSQYDYSIRNRSFESTVTVPRERIDDDQYGIYAPMMEDMGQMARLHPDRLAFELLRAGFSTLCYDGQYFFDTDHPAKNPLTLEEISISNMQPGSASPLFLMDLSRPLKPMIFQERLKPEFVAKDDPATSEEVFMRNQFVYGVYSRYNVGFGFWQMAYASKAALTVANFRAARLAMRSLKKESGEPLGMNPTHIVIGPGNGDAARDIFGLDKLASGATNPEFKAVEVIESLWLD